MRKFLQEINPVKVSEKVSTRLEIANHLKKYHQPILFNNILDYPDFRIVGNLCASRDILANLLHTTRDNLLKVISNALERPKRYKIVTDADFIKKKSVQNPNVIDHLPLVMFYKVMERYYASATIILARDRDTRRENACFHRMMYLGDNRFSIRLVPRDLYNIFHKNKEHGEDTDIVVICGVHPAVSLASATSYPNLNELELANTLMHKQLKCIKMGDLDVPVDSEVVMVGKILCDKVADEGPFVDLTGTWDAVRKEPVVEIESLCMRNDPIWQVILPGGIEHKLLMGLPQEPRMFKIIQNSVPSVKNIVLTTGGCGWLHAVVSIRKQSEGDGKNAGIAALSAHPSLKRVIVVDDDIDVSESENVEWALATRLQPDEGIILIPRMRGSSLDPSSSKSGLTTKWIVDATIPMDRNKTEFMKAEDIPDSQ